MVDNVSYVSISKFLLLGNFHVSYIHCVVRRGILKIGSTLLMVTQGQSIVVEYVNLYAY